MKLSIGSLDNMRKADFYQVHSKENGEGWCNCVAWWLPTWDGWDQRSAEDNREFRNSLFEQSEFDGYLLYLDEKPIGWCQCGRRDRFSKLVTQSKLDPSPETWAITCLVIIPAYRKKGFAHIFLKDILTDLENKGIKHVQGFPKCGQTLSDGEAWTGPESLFVKAGFVVERAHPLWPIYGKRLGPLM
ncbi:MAG: hypothetical protein A2381_06095 [Bdellovibrionales bacterium RIFOXYB1_FULL_37_110]|nr:MAG: hypothetical protein A2417_04980 [Bdellovibrionales bacterium RIFOXYC1_FULL_37_79]OFZ59389.1 MAG: hypothetical protein A2381_06095 [Bdellovibrionales bacterium RIFOXYB1_FULL_37_110]OFZ61949.1 MAG: hypothetical protein A2577_17980 [Bdellovibrionales bacterium RIFOXYD1_FULL_36_51]